MKKISGDVNHQRRIFIYFILGGCAACILFPPHEGITTDE